MGRHALIIAGGSGTRFWPASRKAFPKQFLKLGGELSLLQQTAARVPGLTLWVVCGKAHADLVRHDLPNARVVVEPAAKNTAPAIALALKEILKADPNASVAALPADQHIRDDAAFRATLDRAFDAGGLVTIGIKPTRPETGFGYIEKGDGMDVKRFVEKPDLETAKTFVAAGYLWNGGIFVFDGKHMQSLFETYAPEVWGDFAAAPSISIDYAIAEKAPLKVVTLDAGWSDVGSWDALGEVSSADANGNIGRVFAVDARNNTTSATKPVCLVGVSDLIVVETADAILVCPRGSSQRVKEMVTLLEKDAPSLL